MGTTRWDTIQANQFIGPTPEMNVFGAVWYVDGTNGGDGNSGKSPSKAVATIARAISIASAGDNIVIAPGTYSSAATLVPKARQFFRAAVINPRSPTVTITGTSAVTTELAAIDVAGTAWYGIQFLAGDNALTNLIDIADTADVAGAWFHTCVFNGADKTSVAGIRMVDATFIPSGIVVEHCLFRDLTGTMVDVGVLGMAYSLFRYNYFALDINAGTCFALADTAAFATGKGWEISSNTFLGLDVTADEVGVTIAGTENATGAGSIKFNTFHYFTAEAITINKLSLSCNANYLGAASGTGLTGISVGT